MDRYTFMKRSEVFEKMLDEFVFDNDEANGMIRPEEVRLENMPATAAFVFLAFRSLEKLPLEICRMITLFYRQQSQYCYLCGYYVSASTECCGCGVDIENKLIGTYFRGCNSVLFLKLKTDSNTNKHMVYKSCLSKYDYNSSLRQIYGCVDRYNRIGETFRNKMMPDYISFTIYWQIKDILEEDLSFEETGVVTENSICEYYKALVERCETLEKKGCYVDNWYPIDAKKYLLAK
jgi:hypothetical protein